MKNYSVQTVLFYETKFGQEVLKPGDTVVYNGFKCIAVEIFSDRVNLDNDACSLTVDLNYFVENFKPFVEQKKMITIIKK